VRVKKAVLKEIFLIIVFVGVAFLFGYFMRNVPRPPDCIAGSTDEACVIGEKK